MFKIKLKGKPQYLNNNSRRSSIIVRRHTKGEEIHPEFDYIRIGSSFQRVRDDKAVEIANITGVSTDNFGIPHIRYDMLSKNPYTRSSHDAGSKMLALRTFIDIFQRK